MNMIKKDFVAIVELLKNNENKKVSTILEQVLALCEKKSAGGANGSTLFKDNAGTVVAVFCYYHEKWEVVSKHEKVTAVEYGSKANTASGLNTMCKEGVSNWTKQQRLAKAKHSSILADVAKGAVEASAINDLLAEVEVEKDKIVDRVDGHGFATTEELEIALS